MDFEAPDLLGRLENASDEELDALPFGVIKLSREGAVLAYNRFESEAAGLRPDRVMSRHFFTEVGGCMNNHLVAERFAREDRIDDQVDYLFTLRMRPTPVRLRLLKSPEAAAMYLVVRR